MKTKILLFLSLAVALIPAAAQSIFVDDDYPLAELADGSSRRPFRTIGEALDVARSRRDGGSKAAIVIHVAPGTYVGGIQIDRSKIKLLGSTAFTFDAAGRPLAPVAGTETLIVPGQGGVAAPLGNRDALLLIRGPNTLTEVAVEGLILDGLREDFGTLDAGGMVAADVTQLTVQRVWAQRTGVGFVMRYVRGQIEETAAEETVAGYFLQGGANAQLAIRRASASGLVTGFHVTAGPDDNVASWFGHAAPARPAEYRLEVDLVSCLALGHNNGGFQIIPRSPVTTDFRPTHLVARIAGSTALSAHPNSRGLRIRGFNPNVDLALKTVQLTLEGNDLTNNRVVASATGAGLANFQVSIFDAAGTLTPSVFNYLPGTLGGGLWSAPGTWLSLNGVVLAP